MQFERLNLCSDNGHVTGYYKKGTKHENGQITYSANKKFDDDYPFGLILSEPIASKKEISDDEFIALCNKRIQKKRESESYTRFNTLKNKLRQIVEQTLDETAFTDFQQVVKLQREIKDVHELNTKLQPLFTKYKC